ncbi:hypothetical protein GTO10_05185, partial [Candidatus Saccharibacteria bacterium]|nr:hypothetical protein [Candidatus Saccharibacteria bacterium]
MEYPAETDFKGTVMISPAGKGIAEFTTGDRHYIMSLGLTMTDPMLFDQERIERFSKTISPAKQKQLFNLVRGVSGHLEVEHGKFGPHRRLLFFDYNEERAYVEVDHVWEDLVAYFKQKKRKNKKTIYGLPASPGRATGRCLVLHHESIGMFNRVKEGKILVADTTTPEMTPLMKKAAAIVTDLGGVTCHASIVCRELG